MRTPIAPKLALRAAVVAASATVVPQPAWYTTVAPERATTPFAVWTAGASTDASAETFARGAVDEIDEFSIYADQTSALAATEVAYSVFAQLHDLLHDKKVPLGADALGRPVQTVRARLTMLALGDDPDVPGRARVACRLDATVWSA